MKLARMGSFHASQLSFMRVQLRRLAEKWTFERSTWHFDGTEGVAVYQARGRADLLPDCFWTHLG